mgnify:CR=1 FL=1
MTDRISPIISVIVPVLNAGSFINDCVTSLINQDFPKDQYEIIIVDNGSKDDTINRLTEYGNSITMLHESKKGSYIARNTGINTAKGEIIAFTDADCIADKNWLKELYIRFVSEDIGCVVGSVIPNPGESLVEIYSRNKKILSQETVVDSRYLPYGQTANAAFRKEVFTKIGNFDERLMSGGDADISWRMQIKTDYKLVYNPESIVEHHHRTTFKGLFKQQFSYGFGRIWLYKKYGDHMKNYSDTNYDIRYNMSHSMKLMLNIFVFYIRSFKRLLGFCDKYDMYEPLLSLLFVSGYVLGKMYGTVKLKKSFFSTL